MKSAWTAAHLGLAALGGWLGWFLGGCDALLNTLIAFLIADYISGVLCAVCERRLSSEIGFRGVSHKALILLLVGTANILDMNVIGNGCVLRGAVIFFYLSNEGISLLENAARLGVPIPKNLEAALEQLNKDEK